MAEGSHMERIAIIEKLRKYVGRENRALPEAQTLIQVLADQIVVTLVHARSEAGDPVIEGVMTVVVPTSDELFAALQDALDDSSSFNALYTVWDVVRSHASAEYNTALADVWE